MREATMTEDVQELVAELREWAGELIDADYSGSPRILLRAADMLMTLSACDPLPQETTMREVLSGCAVRAVIQQENASKEVLSTETTHYFKCIKLRLETLYELTEAPNLREQISDEISWVEEKLGIAE